MSSWLNKTTGAIVGGAILAGAIGIWSASRASAAPPPPGEQSRSAEQEPSAELDQNQRRLAIQRTGMLTLLGWSAANIGVGAYGWATTSGSTKYFHQMNVLWNGINAVIGGFGYASAVREDPRGLSEIETIEKTRSIQQILLFNAGLDIAYVAGGAWLRQRGDRRDDEQLMGYGESVMLQGSFLFVFDAILWGVHQKSIGDYKATIGPGPGGHPGATLLIEF